MIVPHLNDRDHISACLASIEHQELTSTTIDEIVVVDGGSTDGSIAVIEEWVALSPDRRRLLHNLDRYVPTAMNAGLAQTASDVVVRVDSHTTLDPAYVEAAVDALQRLDADVVGGLMTPSSGGGLHGEAAAWALTSRWGIGGSAFHHAMIEQACESAYMGVFRRDVFARFGAYDTNFLRNQDDELTYRIREGGGRVWLVPSMRSSYVPRSSTSAVFRQFLGYGRFKPAVLGRHRRHLRLRHLAPPMATVAWLIAPLALALRRPLLVLPASLHGIALVAAGSIGATSAASARARVEVLAAMHLGYGLGFLTNAAGLVTGRPPRRA